MTSILTNLVVSDRLLCHDFADHGQVAVAWGKSWSFTDCDSDNFATVMTLATVA